MTLNIRMKHPVGQPKFERNARSRAVCCAISTTKTQTKKELRRIEDLPIEKGLPFMGNSLKFLDPEFHAGDLFDKHNSDIIRLGMPNGENLAIRTADDMHEGLITRNKDFDIAWPKSTAEIIATGEGVRSVEENRPWRKAILKLMSSNQILSLQLPLMVEIFSSHFSRHVQSEEPVQWMEACKRMSNAVVISSMLGDILTEEDLEYLFPLFYAQGQAVFSPNFNVKGGLPFTVYKKGWEARKELLEFITDKLQPVLEDQSKLPPASVLGNLIKFLEEEGQFIDGSRESAARLAEEVALLEFVGTDTTGTQIARITSLLATHPQWLDALWEEQQALMAEFGPDIDRRVVSRSAVALAVVQEALRLKPILQVVFRQAIQDTSIADVFVPKGTNVMHCIWNALRATGNGRLEFDPSQWLSEDRREAIPNKERGNMVWGGGPRRCVGENLATIEMTVFLVVFARTARSIDMSEADKYQELGIMGTPPTKMPITLQPRS